MNGDNANTFIGSNAGYSNTTGGSNTACGKSALYSNTTGLENTASGISALSSNISGSRNVAIGTTSLATNTTGNQNTAVGAFALWKNETANYNTAFGSQALSDNTTGNQNTAIGSDALSLNFTGNQNTAIGYQALYANSAGNNNTALGQNALSNNSGGNLNIAIGLNSGNLGAALNNNVGIGNGGYLIGSSNTVILGNASTTYIGGAVGFTNQSDGRIKNTILEDVKGLAFILRLRPVTYHVSLKAITTITGNKETPDFPEKYDREKVKYTGFIAQEVEQAAKTAGYDFSGVSIPAKPTELYGLRYSEFVVPLVKGMQEQQAMIDSLQHQLTTVRADNLIQSKKQQLVILHLEKQAALLEKRLAELEAKNKTANQKQ